MTGVVMMKTGWIHTAAHGADFLLPQAIIPNFCPKKAKRHGKPFLFVYLNKIKPSQLERKFA
jgi:hypothetical protein